MIRRPIAYFAALFLVLCSAQAWAQTLDHPAGAGGEAGQTKEEAGQSVDGVESTTPSEEERVRPSAPNYWLPALEILGQQLSFNLAARLMGKYYAEITPETVWTNLTGPWELDEDALLTNEIGHPVQGALYYTAARSSGHGFWSSALYTGLGSLVWEYAWETTKPSFNDQITTTLGGIMVGEVMHRMSRQVLASNRGPDWLRWGALTLLDPMGTLNREAFDFVQEPIDHPDSFGAFSASYGIWFLGEVDEVHSGERSRMVQLSGELVHGLTGDPDYHHDAPLDHFNLSVDLLLSPDGVYGSLFTDALLYGWDFEGFFEDRGVWGFFLNQAYLDLGNVRAGYFGAGLGVSDSFRFGDKGFASFTLSSSFVPMGGTGRRVSEESTGSSTSSGDDFRDYQLGTGTSQFLDLRAGRGDTFVVKLVSHNVELTRLPRVGLEDIMSTTSFGVHGHLWGGHALGAELQAFVSSRRLKDDADSEYRTDSSLQFVLVYSLMSDGWFGVSGG